MHELLGNFSKIPWDSERVKQNLLKMDKWLKRRNLNDDNSNNDNISNQVNEHTPGTSKDTSCSKKYVVHQIYNDVFLKFGFT